MSIILLCAFSEEKKLERDLFLALRYVIVLAAA